MRKILGIDPSLQNTGWGVISSEGSSIKFISAGTIITKPSMDMHERLKIIYESIFKVVSLYTPNSSAIEDIFINKNPISSLKLGQAKAASMLAVINSGIELTEYSPRVIKKALVGTGAADKNQVLAMIKHLLPNSSINNDHESDALAIAICHNNHHF